MGRIFCRTFRIFDYRLAIRIPDGYVGAIMRMVVGRRALFPGPPKVLPRGLRLETGAMIIKHVKLARLAVWVSLLSVAIGRICQAQSTGSGQPPSSPTNTPTSSASVGSTNSSPPVTQSGPSLPPSLGSGGKVMSTTTTVRDSSGASMVITGTGNADPNIVFDLHAVNPTEQTIKFTFFFDIPLVTPFTAGDLMHTHLDITIFQGSIAPTTLPDTDGTFIPIFQTFLGNDGDTGWTPQPLLALGNEVLFESKSYDSGNQFAVPPNPISIFDVDPMSVWVQYTLAPHSDVEVAGNVNAPEPASLICWAGLGLAFAGVYTWRRRRVPE
jgi:hypothetical protein